MGTGSERRGHWLAWVCVLSPVCLLAPVCLRLRACACVLLRACLRLRACFCVPPPACLCLRNPSLKATAKAVAMKLLPKAVFTEGCNSSSSSSGGSGLRLDPLLQPPPSTNPEAERRAGRPDSLESAQLLALGVASVEDLPAPSYGTSEDLPASEDALHYNPSAHQADIRDSRAIGEATHLCYHILCRGPVSKDLVRTGQYAFIARLWQFTGDECVPRRVQTGLGDVRRVAARLEVRTIAKRILLHTYAVAGAAHNFVHNVRAQKVWSKRPRVFDTIRAIYAWGLYEHQVPITSASIRGTAAGVREITDDLSTQLALRVIADWEARHRQQGKSVLLMESGAPDVSSEELNRSGPDLSSMASSTLLAAVNDELTFLNTAARNLIGPHLRTRPAWECKWA